MSSANACLSVSSVMAFPPYFTTSTLPWYFFSHGSAFARIPAWVVAFFQSSGCHSSFGEVLSSLMSCRRSSRGRTPA